MCVWCGMGGPDYTVAQRMQLRRKIAREHGLCLMCCTRKPKRNRKTCKECGRDSAARMRARRAEKPKRRKATSRNRT